MDTDRWLGALKCPKHYHQLDDDLNQYGDLSLNMRVVEEQVHKRWPKRKGSGALVHYVIKDNRVTK